MEALDYDTILIAGGGPVGLLVATVLAHYGVKSVLLERNETTTRWPKMDLTNIRSMELLRRLGLNDDIRKLGVPSTTPYNVYITPGLGLPSATTSWNFPSNEELRRIYREQNDGSMPQEPWQRISQSIFESYLKSRCDENDLIDCRFGWKVEKCIESDEGITVEASNARTGEKRSISSKYLVACDGASSRIRRDMEIELDGGPLPGYALLTHFRSQDLAKLQKHGRFWHLFVYGENGLTGAAISQDDDQIFTTHLLLTMDVDHTTIGSEEAAYRAVGGLGGPYEFAIDEVLVRSTYRHSIAVARRYRSSKGKIFLAGDSAHQNIPTGGYGMNMGIGDAFDIGWKLAAVVKGHAKPFILDSYEEERRPVAVTSIQQSGIHMEVHLALSRLLGPSPKDVLEDSDRGREVRKAIHEHYQSNKGENTDWGIEMDHRHKSCVYPTPSELDGAAPEWKPNCYTPSTMIGSRAPHVHLQCGTSIFDLYGKYWTLFQFVDSHDTGAGVSNPLISAANAIDMPLKHVILSNEDNARKVWQRSWVLVRPDGHVAWRSDYPPNADQAAEIVQVITGRTAPVSSKNCKKAEEDRIQSFAAVEKSGTQVMEYKLENMGAMQS